MGFVWITQPQRSRLTPRLKKKKQERKRTCQTKVPGAGLEGFVDWSGVLDSESVEEDEMFMLTVGFAAQMTKRDADLEDEPTPMPNKKLPKQCLLDVEAEKDWAIIQWTISIEPPMINRFWKAPPTRTVRLRRRESLLGVLVWTKLVRGPL